MNKKETQQITDDQEDDDEESDQTELQPAKQEKFKINNSPNTATRPSNIPV